MIGVPTARSMAASSRARALESTAERAAISGMAKVATTTKGFVTYETAFGMNSRFPCLPYRGHNPSSRRLSA